MKRWAAGVIAILLVVAILATYVMFQSPKPIQIVISGVTLTVEIAKTPEDRQKGLSDRDSMAPDHGMLFVFDHEAAWAFWMKDMRFPLDIIWFNSDRHAVFIKENLQPCTPQDCPAYSPPMNAMYVLEVNAGFVHAHNTTLGETFTLTGA